jgi:beta-1,4-mannosyl-glycoprotein beta-1,4-N-acetylglucosaminyltransferase
MIVDSFLFYNEMKILKLHLEELYDSVDKFILVESTTTFTGNNKPLFFNENKNIYSKYLDKIIHIIVDDTPQSNNPWDSEAFQRNAIDRGIQQLKLDDDDIIIIGDVDEIPDSDILSSNLLSKPISLEMDFYYYNFDCRFKDKWYSSKVLPFGLYKKNPTPNRIRHVSFEKQPKGGWHLSYFGTPEFISNKISNFSHQEYNNDLYNNIEKIRNNITNKCDLFNRGFTFENESSDYLPRNYKIVLD